MVGSKKPSELVYTVSEIRYTSLKIASTTIVESPRLIFEISLLGW